MDKKIINENNIVYKKMGHSKFTRRYGTIIGYIALCIFFVFSTSHFLTISNLITILRQIAPLAILSLGLTFVMITKRADLSIGYSTSILGIIVGATMVHMGLPVWLAVLITLACGAIIGSVNGIAVAFIGIPDFIATLGIGYLLSGLNQAYTKGYSISSLPSGFDLFGLTRISAILPISVVILIIVLLLFWFIISKTKFGRYIYAIGNNEEATMMSGINVKLNILKSYVICGIAAGMAAIVMTSKLGQANPTAGEGYLLDAMAAVYLGATAFRDGEPNLGGTLLGAVIIGTMSNGLTLMNVPYYVKDIATGIIIIVAVTVTALQNMRKK